MIGEPTRGRAWVEVGSPLPTPSECGGDVCWAGLTSLLASEGKTSRGGGCHLSQGGTLYGAWALRRVLVAVRVCVARLRTLLTNPSLRRRLLGGRRRPLVHTPGTEHLSPCTAIGGVFRAGGEDWAAAVSHLSPQTSE